MQLDLFQHVPRFYHRSLEALGELDLHECREALARHRRECPQGPDPEPVAAAARWLEARLPEESTEFEPFAAAALSLCRTLRESDNVPAALAPGTAAARWVVVSLARRALRGWCSETSQTAGPGPLRGLLAVLAGRHAEARRSLQAFFQGKGPDAAAYLALAEAAAALGRDHEAVCAAREGYGLDPLGTAWGPAPQWVVDLRREFCGDPDYAGPWWLVGAYLDQRLPRIEAAPAPVLEARLERFLRTTGEPPAQFYAGLFLSEHGPLLPHAALTTVRRTLRTLHPEAYAAHMECLKELGPLEGAAGKGACGW